MWDDGILWTSFAAMVVKKVLKTFAMSFKLWQFWPFTFKMATNANLNDVGLAIFFH